MRHTKKKLPTGARSARFRKFSFDYYRFMLNTVIEKGFAVTSFERYDANRGKTVIMRHDVDYTLNGVAQLARIEADAGATASYLFRVHAHEYNLFTPHVYRLLHDLRRLGHEIGLHFEAMTVARALGIDPQDLLKKEKRILEDILGIAIATTSEHRDITHVVHETPYYHDVHSPLDAGFRNYAMEPRYMVEMKYLSDSNGVWREGDLLQHIDRHDRFQVLIHPDWWFEEDLLLKGPYFHGLGN